MKVVTCHQPEYLCPLSLIHKAKHADVLVLLDDVQFNRASLQQRAKIDRKSEVSWLSIPFVHAYPQLIRDVKIADPDWAARHANTLEEVYGNTPHFDETWAKISPLYRMACEKLATVSTTSMAILFAMLDVGVDTIFSSSIDVDGAKGERILNICKSLDATHYLSGKSGAAYLDKAAFDAAGIEIAVQDFALPVYREGQPDPKGVGNGLSAVDALMHLGVRVKELIA